MIVQFFGLDSEYRNKIAKNFAKLHNAFFCTDRELPFASQEATYARWLRSIGGLVFRNNLPMFVVSGYFPTKDARNQFKDDSADDKNIFTIWIDTRNIDEVVIPDVHNGNAPTDFNWEIPDEHEYDLRIDKSFITEDQVFAQISLKADFRKKEYKYSLENDTFWKKDER